MASLGSEWDREVSTPKCHFLMPTAVIWCEADFLDSDTTCCCFQVRVSGFHLHHWSLTIKVLRFSVSKTLKSYTVGWVKSDNPKWRPWQLNLWARGSQPPNWRPIALANGQRFELEVLSFKSNTGFTVKWINLAFWKISILKSLQKNSWCSLLYGSYHKYNFG